MFLLITLFIGAILLPNPGNDSDITFRLEEEKLAYQTYAYFYEIWGLRPFQNIMNSEERHYNALLELVKEEHPDFSVGNELLYSKEFQHQSLQELYNEFIERGKTSEVEALKIGAYIEEMDILDLEKSIQNTTNPHHKEVYSSLLAASEQHLRAFNRNLSRRGINYQPELLSQGRFQNIILGVYACDSAYQKGSENSGSRSHK